MNIEQQKLLDLAESFLAIFGDVTPEEVQRRLERAIELRDGARRQCERLQQWKNNGDPLAIAVFVKALNGSIDQTNRAVFATRAILAEVDRAGGLRDPEDHSESTRMRKALVRLVRLGASLDYGGDEIERLAREGLGIGPREEIKDEP